MQFDWFEEDEEDDLSAAQRAFLAGLRQRAQSWSCGPEDTEIVAPGDGCDQWRAVLDVPSQIDNLILITVGVCFDDANIHASEVHNQSSVLARRVRRAWKSSRLQARRSKWPTLRPTGSSMCWRALLSVASGWSAGEPSASTPSPTRALGSAARLLRSPEPTSARPTE
jgi:hypothetical protein